MSEPANDATWKSLVLQGNEAFSEEKYSDADRSFTASLRQAVRLLDLARGGAKIDAAFPIVTSHHNLADTLLRLGQVEEALLHLKTAYDVISEEKDRSGVPYYLRSCCRQQMPIALEKLIRLASALGTDPCQLEAWLSKSES
ncbi:MAG: hypothetical protein ABJN40_22125 [Sneathiella sp.]